MPHILLYVKTGDSYLNVQEYIVITRRPEEKWAEEFATEGFDLDAAIEIADCPKLGRLPTGQALTTF